MDKLKKNCSKVWADNKFLIRPFIVLLCMYLLGVLAIILAGVHYADDVARTGQGYAGWSGFSRYLSTVLSHGLHADNYLTNIAPLSQILGVVMLAIASLVIICAVSGKEVFREKWTKWILRVMAVLPLGLCPYMLECLSYQYDAVYMGMSVLFAVLPFVFCKTLFRKGEWGMYLIMTVIGILVVCMTYQASIGIYPMMVIIVAMQEWNAEKKGLKKVVKYVAVSVVAFVVTVLVFQKLLMIPREVYASNAVPGIGEFFPMLFRHLGHYFELVVSDFRLLWLVLVVIIVVCFVMVFVMRSKRNKMLASVVGVIGVVLMAVMAYVMYAALERPLYTTRAMYAIGAWLAIMGVFVVSSVCRYSWVKALEVTPVVVLSWCFFVFGFTYGNMLREQNTYRNEQIVMVKYDLNELLVKLGDDVKTIQVEGQIGWAPAIAHMPENDYQILRRLLNPTFGKGVPWMGYGITQESGLPGLAYNPDMDLKQQNLPKLKETALYNIYGNNRGVLVEFRGEDLGIDEGE